MPVGDWIAAGKAGAKSVNDLFAVARDNSPDYGMIAKTGMNARSKERQVATKAKKDVINAGIAAEARVRQAEIKADKEGEITNLKTSMKRKAGIVGALGAVAGGGLMAFENNRAKKLQAERDAVADARDAKELSIQEGLINSYSQYTPAEFDKNNPEHNPGWGGNSSTNSSVSTNTSGSSSSLTSSAQSVAAGKGSAGKGGRYSQADLTSFAEQAGFSPEQARVMGAIGMGESGGNAGIDTVQSGLDPNRSNEYSVGLFQINAQAHGDKLSKLGYTSDDLRDPVKNAKVAKMVYDEVGGFTPWSVYTKGIYKDYL